MLYLQYVAVQVVLICMSFYSVSAQATLNAADKTTFHLKKFRTDYIKSMMDKNPALLASYYAEDIRLMPEFQKTILGKNNALYYYKVFSARFEVKSYTRTETEIFDLGAQIVEFGKFSMNLVLKSTGIAYDIHGKYQNIWKKSVNHELMLITEAWNYNHSVAIEEYFRFAEVTSVDIALQAHTPINSSISFELAAFNRLQEVTIMQHDASIWQKFYTDDGMFLYSRHPVYQGRKAIDDFLMKHVNEDMPIFEKLDIRNDRIDVLGDYVVEYASHIANWRSGDYSGVNTGKDIRIWRREPDCSLKIFRAMAMYD